MFGLNWVDPIILAILVATGIASRRLGLLRQASVIVCYVTALLLASWLWPRLLPIKDLTLLTIVNANLVLLTATYAAVRGFDLARYLRRRLPKHSWRRWETNLGVVPGMAVTLIIVWLLATMIGRLPFVGLSNSVTDALIIQTLNRHLPSVPAVFDTFNNLVDPNDEPYVMAETKPSLEFAYSEADFQAAAASGKYSVVRITGFGCGGLVTGSGFVVASDLVATNAHVIAGVKRPIFKYDNHSFETVPVLFDANRDVAILRVIETVHKFAATPLRLSEDSVPANTTVAVAGYPGGDYQAAPGIIRFEGGLASRNIYKLGSLKRPVYEVQTRVESGSSGGPIILPNGRVAGIVFSRSQATPDYAYALASYEFSDEVDRARQQQHRVSTGACIRQ